MSWLSAWATGPVGSYAVQVLLHAVLTMLLVDSAIIIWQVRIPAERYRLRLLVLVLPVAMPTLYQALFPERGSFYFRLDNAVFDSTAWFSWPLFGSVSVGDTLFAAVVGSTTVVVVLQELLPIARQLVGRRQLLDDAIADRGLSELVGGLAPRLGVDAPPVLIVEDEEPMMMTLGVRQASIVISRGLLARLSPDELQMALMHELAHVARRSNPIILAVFLLRLWMFFNPVGLLAFRRLLHEDELVCDDVAVASIFKPQSLASALRFFVAPKGSDAWSNVQNHSHNLLLTDRIGRLNGPEAGKARPWPWWRDASIAAAVSILCFYVV